MTTKLQLCKSYLKSGRSISPVEAAASGMGMRLADLIYRLRREENMPIVTEIRVNPTTGEKYARYRLVQLGDRIVIKDGVATPWYNTGDKGTVTDILSYGIDVRFDEPTCKGSGNREWLIKFHDFEVIPS